jgi:hypothetical protein
MQHECSQSIGPTFLSFAMRGSAALITFQWSISSVGASRASHIARPEGEPEAPMIAICGLSFAESFASLSPDGSWARMFQGYSQLTLEGSSEAFSGTWPSSGTMRNGQCYPRAPWVRHTHAKECSLWPTPMAQEGTGGGSAQEAQRILDRIPRASGHLGQLRLKDLWKLRSNKAPMSVAFVATLMGFPTNWCNLED